MQKMCIYIHTTVYIYIHMRYLIHLYLLIPAHMHHIHPGGAFQEMTPGRHEAVHWHLHAHAEPHQLCDKRTM